jgi:hypothetical protein
MSHEAVKEVAFTLSPCYRIRLMIQQGGHILIEPRRSAVADFDPLPQPVVTLPDRLRNAR